MSHSIATTCSGWATSQQTISKYVTIKSKGPDHQLDPVKYQTTALCHASRGPCHGTKNKPLLIMNIFQWSSQIDIRT